MQAFRFLQFLSISVLWASLSMPALQAKPPEKLETALPAPATTLSTLKIDHMMIGVNNFDETMRWYQEKLGFREELRWDMKGLDGVQSAYLTLNGFRIQVMGPNLPTSGPAPLTVTEHLTTLGYGHLCFSVDDVDTAIEELASRGVYPFLTPMDYPGSQRRIALIRDNNGHVIELVGPLKAVSPTE